MSAALAVLPKTIGELRSKAVLALRAAGIESAEADARLLLAHVTGLSAAQLLSAPDDEIQNDRVALLERLLARRVAREPVSRIVGAKEFWSLSFALGDETLVPRPETETVVEAALGAFPDKSRRMLVLDLGTGSGAILAAILMERPLARGVAVDRSAAALAIARNNFDALAFSDRATLICGDWAAALGGSFDLIVANPPYIATGEMALLSPEVRDHDPRLALDGGPDGLSAYRAIVNQIGELLAPGGVAVLELGIGQEQAVSALVCATGDLAPDGAARRDLSGIPRALVIQRR